MTDEQSRTAAPEWDLAGAVRVWLLAKRDLAEAEDIVETVKERVRECERAALAAFEKAGVASVRLDGRTVSLQRKVFASIVSGHKTEAIQALQDLGLGDLVNPTVNASSLSSYVREQEKLGEPIPEVLADHLNIGEVFRLAARKS